MNILIITQKVDKKDGYFGFFHSWLIRFAHECENVHVITLEEYTHELPENVHVHSLKKEQGSSKVTRFVIFWNLIWKLRHEYDVVFCHMSPIYVIAGAPLWKLARKPIALWYIHRNVDLKLRIAEKLVNMIFTASPESFRIQSNKRRFMQQAVDTDVFTRKSKHKRATDTPIQLVSVGRITAIKNLDTIIRAVTLLYQKGIAVNLTLVGSPVLPKDNQYLASLRALISTQGVDQLVTFAGSIPFERINQTYSNADFSINACPTGGMDKAVLESLATGTLAIVANTAFGPVLEPYALQLMVKEKDPKVLAEAIAFLSVSPERTKMEQMLSDRIRHEYDLKSLIHKVCLDLAIL